MQSPIQPALEKQLELNSTSPLAVEVAFREWPSESELAGLGLRREGDVAKGRVWPAKIRALAAFPQVASIDFDGNAPAEVRDPKSKLGGSLQQALHHQESDRYTVGVLFSAPPASVDVAGLTVEGTSGWGTLTVAEIDRLLQRSDTMLVDLLPRMNYR